MEFSRRHCMKAWKGVEKSIVGEEKSTKNNVRMPFKLGWLGLQYLWLLHLVSNTSRGLSIF